MGKMITVMSVDDHALFSAGIEMLISAQTDMSYRGSISNPQIALQRIKAIKPEIVLLDIRMPVINGFELSKQIQNDASIANCKLIYISTHQDPKTLSDAIANGAKGYISKDSSPEILLDTIRHVSNGRLCFHQTPPVNEIPGSYTDINGKVKIDQLSNREREVFYLSTQGLSVKEISELLHLSEATVKSHVSKILTKLGLTSRIQLIAYAYRNNLVV